MLISSVVASLLLFASDPGADAAKGASDDSTVRCRKLEVTGSLIRKVRVCKTNAEWRTISEQQSKDAEDLVERNRSLGTPSN